MKNTINEYTNDIGESPYAEWLGGLRDARAKAKVIMQVDKMELGVFGDSQPIGDGLSELRIHYGWLSGVLQQGRKQVYLLLCGGDKSTQANDIKQAKAYWQDHKRRHPHGA